MSTQNPNTPIAPLYNKDKRFIVDDFAPFLKKMREKDPSTPADDYTAFFYAKQKYGQHYKLPDNPPEWITSKKDYNQEAVFDEEEVQDRTNPDQHGYLSDAIRAGGNTSVLGYAKQFAFGSPIYDEDENENLDLAQEGIAFVSSLVHDFWYFLGTRGTGGLTYLAGSTAKKAAAEKAATILFPQAVKGAIKNKTLQTVTQKQAKKVLNKKFASHAAQEKAMLDIVDDPVEKAIIERLGKGARGDANNKILSMMASKEFLKNGAKVMSADGKKVVYELSAPHYGRIAHAFGRHTGAQLAGYSGLHNLEGQMVQGISELINPQTGLPYGKSAPAMFSRWKRHGFKEMDNINLYDVLASTAEGAIGGYMVGAFGGLQLASRAGALNKYSQWKKFVKKPGMQRAIEGLSSKYAELPASALIFTGTQFGMKPIHEAVGGEVGDDNFGEALFKNFIFFGMHKLYGKVQSKALETGKVGLDEINSVLATKKLEAKKLFDKIRPDFEGEQSAEINKTISAREKKAEKVRTDLQTRAIEMYAEIRELANLDSPNNKEFDMLRTKLQDFQGIVDKFIEYGYGIPNHLKPVTKNVSRILKTMDKLDRERQKNRKKSEKDKKKVIVVKDDDSPMTRKEFKEMLQEDHDNKLIDKARKNISKKVRESINLDVLGGEKNHRKNVDLLTLYAGSENKKVYSEDVPFLKRFAQWLDGLPNSRNLANFDAQNVQDYFQAMKFKSQSYKDTIIRFANRVNLNRDNQLLLKRKDIKSSDLAKEGNTEVLTPGEIKANHRKVLMTTGSQTNESGGFLNNARYTAITAGKSMLNSGVRVLNHLWSQLASRGIAIRRLKMGDIKKEANPKTGKDEYRLTLREKQSKKVEVLIENIKEFDGLNYAKELIEYVEHRVAELKAKGMTMEQIQKQPLFEVKTTRNKSGKSFDATDLKDFVKEFGGGKITPHRIRHSLLQMAISLDRMRIDNGKEPKWTSFVDISLLDHSVAVGISVVGMEYYAGGKQLYSARKRNAMRRQFMREVLKHEKEFSVKKETIDLVESLMSKNKDVGLETEGDAPPRVGGSKQKLVVLKNRKILTEKQQREKIVEHLLKNPGMEIKLEDFTGQGYAGRIVDSVIRLVNGKTDITTFFHENIHRLEDFVRLSGNKKLVRLWNKGVNLAKHTKDPRYKRFVEAYGSKKAAKEYLTQLGAEWSAQWETAGKFKKIGLWGKQLVSELKAWIGKSGYTDVARIFGKKAQEGFATPSTDGYKRAVSELNKAQRDIERFQKETGSDIEIEDKMYSETKAKLDKEIKRLNLDPETFEAVKAMSGLHKDILLENISETQANHLIDMFQQVELEGPRVGKRKLSSRRLQVKAQIMRRVVGITDALHREIADHLGIPGSSLKYGSDMQFKQYIEFLQGMKSKFESKEPIMNQAAIHEVMKDKPASLFNNIRRDYIDWVLPVDYVLRKFGNFDPKHPTVKLADKILDHFQSEAEFFGYGNYKLINSMRWIKKSLGVKGKITGYNDKKVADRLKDIALLLDPDLQKGLDISAESRRFMERTKLKDTPESKAFAEIKSMYDFYYNVFFKQASEMLSPHDFEVFKKEFKKKYIESYFTRVLTPKAVEYFNVGQPGHERMVEEVHKSMVRTALGSVYGKEIKKLKDRMEKVKTEGAKNSIKDKIRQIEVKQAKEEKKMLNLSNVLGKRMRDDASRQVLAAIHREPNQLINKFLLERMPKFDNTFTIKDPVSGRERTYNTYELNPEKTMGRYIRTMSGFLATQKHLPEFLPSGIRGKYSSSSTSSDILATMKKSGWMGDYASTVLTNRLGLQSVGWRTAEKQRQVGVLTRYTALFGLSSPTSGLKNFLIGSVMTVGTFGVRGFASGTVKALTSQEARDYVTQIGGREIGTKELELSGVGKWWMDNVSMMSTTEAANRMISVWAGRHTAQHMAGLLSGKKQYFDMWGLREKETIKQMKNLWELNDADIEFIRRYGLSKGEHLIKGKAGRAVDQLIDHYLDHISHWSHIKTQGATAEPFLPLWAGSGYGKSLTLFYRMAYSATHNIKKNIINPAMRGNVFPLVRYTLAGQWAGEQMWGLYAWALGQGNPKEGSSNFWDRVLVNASKIEMLGLFSFLLNPYGKLSADNIFTPAIIRNSKEIASYVNNGLPKVVGFKKENPPLLEQTTDLAKSVIVFLNHVDRVVEKVRNPNKARHKVMRQTRDAWYKQSRFSKEDGRVKVERPTQHKKYQNIVRETFLNEDWEMASNMYWASWYSIYDNLVIESGGAYYMAPHRAEEQAYASMDAVLDNLNPVTVPDANGNIKGELAYTRKESYLNWLESNNPELHKELKEMEKKYHYNRRQFKKLLHKNMPKMRDTYYEKGKVIDDMWWSPPTGNVFGIPYEKEIKYKQSRRSRTTDPKLPKVEYKP